MKRTTQADAPTLKVYRGQPIRDEHGQPTGKRHPIRSRERTIVTVLRQQAEAHAGRRLTKRERHALKRSALAFLAAKLQQEATP